MKENWKNLHDFGEISVYLQAVLKKAINMITISKQQLPETAQKTEEWVCRVSAHFLSKQKQEPETNRASKQTHQNHVIIYNREKK